VSSFLKILLSRLRVIHARDPPAHVYVASLRSHTRRGQVMDLHASLKEKEIRMGEKTAKTDKHIYTSQQDIY
jgi:hypothetical protein